MTLPAQREHRALATLEEELRTIAECHRLHLADKFFAPTEAKTFLSGERAGLLHILVKASIFDEGELENGVAGPKGLSDDKLLSNTFIYYLASHKTTGS